MDKILKEKIKDQIILDRRHQHIIAALNQKIEHLEVQLKETKNVEKNHQRINGLLHKDLDKLQEQNNQLKKENDIIKEGNDYIGVFNQDMINKFKKLSDDMTSNIKTATPLVKKYNHNILFMKSVQSLIRFNQQLEEILKKFIKN